MNNPMERKFLSLCVCIFMGVYVCMCVFTCRPSRPEDRVRSQELELYVSLELPNTGIGSTLQLSTRAADTLNP